MDRAAVVPHPGKMRLSRVFADDKPPSLPYTRRLVGPHHPGADGPMGAIGFDGDTEVCQVRAADVFQPRQKLIDIFQLPKLTTA